MDVLSHTAAIELGPRDVTSNVITPGPISGTEGMERLATVESYESAMRGIPLGRPGTVKDVADATVYIFSDAGNFVSGQTLVGEFILPEILSFSDADLGFYSRRSSMADCAITSRSKLQVS